MIGQFRLLRTRRFLPLLVTFFLGAANDNLFRNAMVILILYRLAEQQDIDGKLLVTMAAGIFILPFFLFSATAGQLADKHDKSALIRWVKVAEIAIMVMGAFGLWLGDAYFLLSILFLMGAQSAFFGPVKYSILPVHLREEELIGGNALMAAGTFVAILAGTIAGTLLILGEHGVAIVSAGVLATAALGWAASLRIPEAKPVNPDLAVNYNLATATWRILRLAAASRAVLLSVLGISWFWVVGATLLSQFPNLAKFNFNADNQVVTLCLVVTTLGIATGSLVCNRLLKGEVSAKYVAFGAIGVSVFLADLWLASPLPGEIAGPLRDAAAFLADTRSWRPVLDIFLAAVSGGIYTVPLYAILQSRPADGERSRIVAANNVLNALFMVVASLAATAMLAASADVTEIFLVLAGANLIFVALLWRLR